jgi:ABC-type multidrug transport system ATPase subunit
MDNSPNAHHGDTVYLQESRLMITWPDGSQHTYPLKQDQTRIGRGEEHNDIPVPDTFKSISRKHLEIQRTGAVFQVIINKFLEDGDMIHIGTRSLNQQVQMIFQVGVASTITEPMRIIDRDSPIVDTRFETQPPTDCPYLKLQWPNGNTSYFSMNKESVRLGRDPDNDLIFPQRLLFISKHHAEFVRTESGFCLIDLDSTNGTRVNNQYLEPGIPTRLTNQSVIRIGDDRFGISIGMTYFDITEPQLTVPGFSPVTAAPTQISKQHVTVIGRSEECDVILPSPKVSRNHARIRQVMDSYWIEDLNSTNGTYVNQQLAARIEIHNGDVITIGDHILVFKDGQLQQFQSQGMRLDVTDLSKEVSTRKGPLRILHDVNMTILPREFVAIVGGSGAGKSTLMNALIGFRPGGGSVALNGHDFYDAFEHFRAQLGFVPQSDIMHTSLTVERALDYAARLRLPIDVNAAEREARISAVLETVSMNTETIRKTRISNLSGGQRKRVSISVELLADPKLIYLDEATSGLDPGLEKKLMYTLRQMADEGRTIILITHATANIVQTDQVAFLSQGRLVYFGPSKNALDFFEVDDFADIYERIERHGSEWQEIYQERKPEMYERYVAQRSKTKPAASKSKLPAIRFGIRDFVRQFAILTQRAVRVLMSDWFTLVLMLLLFPLTATLQLMISTSNVLVGDLSILSDPAAAAKSMVESYLPFADLNTFVFVMGLEAVLVGMYVPSNELIKERNIYLRERMVTLRILPYLLSKVAVFTVFAAIQTFLYLVVLSLGVDLPDQGLYFSGPMELFITLFLTMLASMGIGLVVSAISRGSDMAIYILVILLFFQFFFSGTVFDLRDKATEPLSYLTSTRWALSALGVTIDMEAQVEASILCNAFPDDPRTPENEADHPICFNYPDATENLMLPYGDEILIQSWIILVAMAFISITFTGFLIRRLES